MRGTRRNLATLRALLVGAAGEHWAGGVGRPVFAEHERFETVETRAVAPRVERHARLDAVWSRNCSRVHPCSVATCGSRNPRGGAMFHDEPVAAHLHRGWIGHRFERRQDRDSSDSLGRSASVTGGKRGAEGRRPAQYRTTCRAALRLPAGRHTRAACRFTKTVTKALPGQSNTGRCSGSTTPATPRRVSIVARASASSAARSRPSRSGRRAVAASSANSPSAALMYPTTCWVSPVTSPESA